jgi:Cu/Ag efflux protein CusF
MRKFLLPLTMAAAIAVSSLSFAQETTLGIVASLDAETMTVTLEDGSSYQMKDQGQFEQLQAGDNVSVTWEDVDGTMVASDVTVDQ